MFVAIPHLLKLHNSLVPWYEPIVYGMGPAAEGSKTVVRCGVHQTEVFLPDKRDPPVVIVPLRRLPVEFVLRVVHAPTPIRQVNGDTSGVGRSAYVVTSFVVV